MFQRLLIAADAPLRILQSSRQFQRQNKSGNHDIHAAPRSPTPPPLPPPKKKYAHVSSYLGPDISKKVKENKIRLFSRNKSS